MRFSAGRKAVVADSRLIAAPSFAEKPGASSSESDRLNTTASCSIWKFWMAIRVKFNVSRILALIRSNNQEKSPNGTIRPFLVAIKRMKSKSRQEKPKIIGYTSIGPDFSKKGPSESCGRSTDFRAAASVKHNFDNGVSSSVLGGKVRDRSSVFAHDCLRFARQGSKPGNSCGHDQHQH